MTGCSAITLRDVLPIQVQNPPSPRAQKAILIATNIISQMAVEAASMGAIGALAGKMRIGIFSSTDSNASMMSGLLWGCALGLIHGGSSAIEPYLPSPKNTDNGAKQYSLIAASALTKGCQAGILIGGTAAVVTGAYPQAAAMGALMGIGLDLMRTTTPLINQE